jgi:outer membrane protein OmpA-like peptidoglycan-associated protein
MTDMRSVILATVLGVSVLVCGSAYAAKTWDDMSWWGNTGAKPEPKADSKGRAGCWWLPVEAVENDKDAELWGNRGILFHAWKKPAAEPKSPPPLHGDRGPIDYKITIMNNILFDQDKAVIKAEAKPEIDKVVVELKRYPKDTMTVEGHTSSDGDAAYNMALGQRRADAVKKYMVESGIAPERIKAVSFGETRPAVPNDSPANMKLNRRVEFRYHMGDW